MPCRRLDQIGIYMMHFRACLFHLLYLYFIFNLYFVLFYLIYIFRLQVYCRQKLLLPRPSRRCLSPQYTVRAGLTSNLFSPINLVVCACYKCDLSNECRQMLTPWSGRDHNCRQSFLSPVQNNVNQNPCKRQSVT